MPEADPFEAPQGGTFYGVLLQAVTEAFAGNGIQANGEARVTADSGVAMGVNVSGAPTGLRYAGTDYTPNSASFTLSQGPTTTTNGQDDRRADLIFFDSSASSFAKYEGNAHPYPEPPTPPTDGLVIAVVTVPHNATDIGDSSILNWRPIPTQADDIPIDDAGNEFGTDTVEAALQAANQGLSELTDYDVAGNDVTDAGTTLYDATAGEFPNGVIEALANFASNDVISGYPLSLATDTEATQYPLSLANDTEASAYPLVFGTDVEYNTLAEGTITHTGGSPTAFSVSGLTTTEASTLNVSVGVASAPAFAGDYAFNFDWSHRWNDTVGEVVVDIQLNWDVDPGSGNDVNLQYSITQR